MARGSTSSSGAGKMPTTPDRREPGEVQPLFDTSGTVAFESQTRADRWAAAYMMTPTPAPRNVHGAPRASDLGAAGAEYDHQDHPVNHGSNDDETVSQVAPQATAVDVQGIEGQGTEQRQLASAWGPANANQQLLPAAGKPRYRPIRPKPVARTLFPSASSYSAHSLFGSTLNTGDVFEEPMGAIGQQMKAEGDQTQQISGLSAMQNQPKQQQQMPQQHQIQQQGLYPQQQQQMQQPAQNIPHLQQFPMQRQQQAQTPNLSSPPSLYPPGVLPGHSTSLARSAITDLATVPTQLTKNSLPPAAAPVAAQAMANHPKPGAERTRASDWGPPPAVRGVVQQAVAAPMGPAPHVRRGGLDNRTQPNTALFQTLTSDTGLGSMVDDPDFQMFANTARVFDGRPGKMPDRFDEDEGMTSAEERREKTKAVLEYIQQPYLNAETERQRQLSLRGIGFEEETPTQSMPPPHRPQQPQNVGQAFNNSFAGAGADQNQNNNTPLAPMAPVTPARSVAQAPPHTPAGISPPNSRTDISIPEDVTYPTVRDESAAFAPRSPRAIHALRLVVDPDLTNPNWGDVYYNGSGPDRLIPSQMDTVSAEVRENGGDRSVVHRALLEKAKERCRKPN